jgi:hypothetical protein
MSQAARLGEYFEYHEQMYEIGDIDPGYPMLRYVCDRFELNTEQRYWLAFLYAATYSPATVYYIYNRFPDFEMVDLDAMTRWWDTEGRENCIFQSDRSWVRSRNQFVAMVSSYRQLLGNLTQGQTFLSLSGASPEATYRNCFEAMGRIFQMGRFALFLYLEAVHVVTGFNMKPDRLDLRNAESSRNGICYAIERDNLITGKDLPRQQLTPDELCYLEDQLNQIMLALQRRQPTRRTDIWNVETTLCAYKKYKRGKRYLGYYIDRQGKEISQMAERVTQGVDWTPLWDYRRENLAHVYLKELS